MSNVSYLNAAVWAKINQPLRAGSNCVLMGSWVLVTKPVLKEHELLAYYNCAAGVDSKAFPYAVRKRGNSFVSESQQNWVAKFRRARSALNEIYGLLAKAVDFACDKCTTVDKDTSRPYIRPQAADGEWLRVVEDPSIAEIRQRFEYMTCADRETLRRRQMLNDRVIDFFQAVLRLRYRHVNGLQPVVGRKVSVQRGEIVIQFHFQEHCRRQAFNAVGHWVLSSTRQLTAVRQKPVAVSLWDSLQRDSGTGAGDECLQHTLNEVHGMFGASASVCFKTPVPQSGSVECGYYCIAYALGLACGVPDADIVSCRLKFAEMGEWLLKAFCEPVLLHWQYVPRHA